MESPLRESLLGKKLISRETDPNEVEVPLISSCGAEWSIVAADTADSSVARWQRHLRVTSSAAPAFADVRSLLSATDLVLVEQRVNAVRETQQSKRNSIIVAGCLSECRRDVARLAQASSEEALCNLLAGLLREGGIIDAVRLMRQRKCTNTGANAKRLNTLQRMAQARGGTILQRIRSIWPIIVCFACKDPSRADFKAVASQEAVTATVELSIASSAAASVASGGLIWPTQAMQSRYLGGENELLSQLAPLSAKASAVGPEIVARLCHVDCQSLAGTSGDNDPAGHTVEEHVVSKEDLAPGKSHGTARHRRADGPPQSSNVTTTIDQPCGYISSSATQQRLLCSRVVFSALCCAAGTSAPALDPKARAGGGGRSREASAAGSSEPLVLSHSIAIPAIAASLPAAVRHAYRLVGASTGAAGSSSSEHDASDAATLAMALVDAFGDPSTSTSLLGSEQAAGCTASGKKTDELRFQWLLDSIVMPCAHAGVVVKRSDRSQRSSKIPLGSIAAFGGDTCDQAIKAIMPELVIVGSAILLIANRASGSQRLLRRQFRGGASDGMLPAIVRLVGEADKKDERTALARILLCAACNSVCTKLSDAVEGLLWQGCDDVHDVSIADRAVRCAKVAVDGAEVASPEVESLHQSPTVLVCNLFPIHSVHLAFIGGIDRVGVGEPTLQQLRKQAKIAIAHAIAADTFTVTSDDDKSRIEEHGQGPDTTLNPVDQVRAALSMARPASRSRDNVELSCAFMTAGAQVSGDIPSVESDDSCSFQHLHVAASGRAITSSSEGYTEARFAVDRRTLHRLGAIDALAETSGNSISLPTQWLARLEQMAHPLRVVPCIAPAVRKLIERRNPAIARLRQRYEKARRKATAALRGDSSAAAALHRALVSSSGAGNGSKIAGSSTAVFESQEAYFLELSKAWVAKYARCIKRVGGNLGAVAKTKRASSEPSYGNLQRIGILSQLEWDPATVGSRCKVSPSAVIRLAVFRDLLHTAAASRIQATLRGIQLRRMIQSRSSCCIELRNALHHAAELLQEAILGPEGETLALPPGSASSTSDAGRRTSGGRGFRAVSGKSATPSVSRLAIGGSVQVVSRVQVERELRLSLRRIKPLPKILQPTSLVWAAKHVVQKLSRQNKVLKEVRACEKLDIEDERVYDRLAAALDEAIELGLAARDEIIRANRRRQTVMDRMEARRALEGALQSGKTEQLERGISQANSILASKTTGSLHSWFGGLVLLIDRAKGMLTHAKRIEQAVLEGKKALASATWIPRQLIRPWKTIIGVDEDNQDSLSPMDVEVDPSGSLASAATPKSGKARRRKPRRRRKSQYEEMLGLSSVFDGATAERGALDSSERSTERATETLPTPHTVQSAAADSVHETAIQIILQHSSDHRSTSQVDLEAAFGVDGRELRQKCQVDADTISAARTRLQAVEESARGIGVYEMHQLQEMLLTLASLEECRRSIASGDRPRLARELVRLFHLGGSNFFHSLFCHVRPILLAKASSPDSPYDLLHAVNHFDNGMDMSDEDTDTGNAIAESTSRQLCLSDSAALEAYYLFVCWQNYRSVQMLQLVLTDPSSQVRFDGSQLNEMKLPGVFVPDRAEVGLAAATLLITCPSTDALAQHLQAINSYANHHLAAPSRPSTRGVVRHFAFDDYLEEESDSSDDESDACAPTDVDGILDSLYIDTQSPRASPRKAKSSRMRIETSTFSPAIDPDTLVSSACVCWTDYPQCDSSEPSSRARLRHAVAQHGVRLVQQYQLVQENRRRIHRERAAEIPVSPRRSVAPVLRRGATALLRRRASMMVGSAQTNLGLQQRRRRPAFMQIKVPRVESGSGLGSSAAISRVVGLHSSQPVPASWLFDPANPPWGVFSSRSDGQSLVFPRLDHLLQLSSVLIGMRTMLKDVQQGNARSPAERIQATAAIRAAAEQAKSVINDYTHPLGGRIQVELDCVCSFCDHLTLYLAILQIFSVSSDADSMGKIYSDVTSYPLGRQYCSETANSMELLSNWSVIRLFCDYVGVGQRILTSGQQEPYDLHSLQQTETNELSKNGHHPMLRLRAAREAGAVDTASSDAIPLKRIQPCVPVVKKRARTSAAAGRRAGGLLPTSKGVAGDQGISMNEVPSISRPRAGAQEELLARFDALNRRFTRIRQSLSQLRSRQQSSRLRLGTEVASSLVLAASQILRLVRNSVGRMVVGDAVRSIRHCLSSLTRSAAELVHDGRSLGSMDSMSLVDRHTMHACVSALSLLRHSGFDSEEAVPLERSHGMRVLRTGVLVMLLGARITAKVIQLRQAGAATLSKEAQEVATTILFSYDQLGILQSGHEESVQTEFARLYGFDLCHKYKDQAAGLLPSVVQQKSGSHPSLPLARLAADISIPLLVSAELQTWQDALRTVASTARHFIRISSLRTVIGIASALPSLADWTQLVETTRTLVSRVFHGVQVVRQRPYMQAHDLSWAWITTRSSTKSHILISMLGDATGSSSAYQQRSPLFLSDCAVLLESTRGSFSSATAATAAIGHTGRESRGIMVKLTPDEDKAVLVLECIVALLGGNMVSSTPVARGLEEACVEAKSMVEWLDSVKAEPSLGGMRWLAQVFASRSLWNSLSDTILVRVRRCRSFQCHFSTVATSSYGVATQAKLPTIVENTSLQFSTAIWWMASCSLLKSQEQLPLEVSGLQESMLVNSGALAALAKSLSCSPDDGAQGLLTAESAVHLLVELHGHILRDVSLCFETAPKLDQRSSPVVQLASQLQVILSSFLPRTQDSEIQRAKDHPIGATLLQWVTSDLAALASLAEALNALHIVVSGAPAALNPSSDCRVTISSARPRNATESPLALMCDWLTTTCELTDRWAHFQSSVLEALSAVSDDAPHARLQGVRDEVNESMVRFLRFLRRNVWVVQLRDTMPIEDKEFTTTTSKRVCTTIEALDGRISRRIDREDATAESTAEEPRLFADRVLSRGSGDATEMQTDVDRRPSFESESLASVKLPVESQLGGCSKEGASLSLSSPSSGRLTDGQKVHKTSAKARSLLGFDAPQLLESLLTLARTAVGIGTYISESATRTDDRWRGKLSLVAIEAMLGSHRMKALGSRLLACFVGASECLRARMAAERIGTDCAACLGRLSGTESADLQRMSRGTSRVWLRSSSPAGLQQEGVFIATMEKYSKAEKLAIDLEKPSKYTLQEACGLIVRLHSHAWAGDRLMASASSRLSLRSVADYASSFDLSFVSPREGLDITTDDAVHKVYIAAAVGSPPASVLQSELREVSTAAKRLLSVIDAALEVGYSLPVALRNTAKIHSFLESGVTLSEDLSSSRLQLVLDGSSLRQSKCTISWDPKSLLRRLRDGLRAKVKAAWEAGDPVKAMKIASLAESFGVGVHDL